MGTHPSAHLFFRGAALSDLLCAQSAQNAVRIPRPKVGELAHQTQGVGIFAAGEYSSGASFAFDAPLTAPLFCAILRPSHSKEGSKE